MVTVLEAQDAVRQAERAVYQARTQAEHDAALDRLQEAQDEARRVKAAEETR